jgi:DNA-binding transcriptional LysR family regulator
LTRQGEILAAHGRRLLNAQQKAFDAMVDDASRPSSALS